MTMKKNIYIYILLISSYAISNVVSSGDVPSAHDLQRRLHDAHHKKLCIIQEADTNGHFRKIMYCHERISSIETHGAATLPKTLNPNDCTTTKCQIMRLIHQISFNVQALMKLMKPEDVAKIKELNQQIHELKALLKKYGIEDKTFEKHPISVYL